MIAEETPDEEELVALLAAYDDELAAGTGEGSVASGMASARLGQRFDRHAACLRMLRDAWPGGDSGASETARFSAARAAPAEAPSQIGRFRILRELGQGGYGVVFLAYDSELRREVALKVPRTNVFASAELTLRFRHEARIAASLDHPNIVPVYDAGQVGPICYIASAYCPGPSLAAWLKERTEPVPFDRAARLVAELADGVQHAHSRGVLHRDLKPANVLLQSEAGDDAVVESNFVPRITDFGLAKLLEETDGSDTKSGTVLGTPNYMAPEQASGRSRDATTACDVYALGGMLYELLTGDPPFKADTALATLRRLENEEAVPPSRARRGLPVDLESICLKCLRKRPAERYAGAHALAEDLRRFVAGKPVEARPIGSVERVRLWARRKPVVAGLTVAVAALVLAIAIGAPLAAWSLKRERDAATRALIAESAARKKARQAVDNYVKAVSSEPVLRDERTADLRKVLLQDALGYYKEFVRENAGNRTVARELAESLIAVGDISYLTGSKEQAGAAFEQARELLADLIAANPNDLAASAAWASTVSRLGGARREAGDLAGAARQHRDALQVRRQLVELAPGRNEFRADLAASLHNLGGLALESGSLEECREFFDESRRIREPLAESGDSEARANLAETYQGLAVLAVRVSDRGLALVWLEQARQTLEELVDSDPEVTLYRKRLASTWMNLGNVHRELGDAAALQDYERSLEQSAQIAAENPHSTDLADDLANGRFNLGLYLRELGEPVLARAAFESAIAGWTRLHEANPSVVSFEFDLVGAMTNLGLTYRDVDDSESALRHIEQAARLVAELAQRHPGALEIEAELAANTGLVGLLNRDLERDDEALRQMELARDRYLALRERFPSDERIAIDLARTYSNLGLVHQDAGRHAEAVAEFQKSAGLRRELLRSEGIDVSVTRELAKTLVRLASSLEGLGRPNPELGRLAEQLGASQGTSVPSQAIADLDRLLVEVDAALGETASFDLAPRDGNSALDLP